MKKIAMLLTLLALPAIPFYSFAASDNTAASASANKSNIVLATRYGNSMLIYFILFLLLFLFFYQYFNKKNITLSRKNERILLFTILAAALLIRVCFAPVIEGWPNDISANKYWAANAAKGLSSFYSSGWCDYPPLFIYVLALVGKLAAIPWLSGHFTLLVKLPSILADLVTAYLIYKVAGRQLKPILAVTAAAAYAFHPAVFLDSTIWGQVDSFFTMIIVAALILLLDKRLEASAVLFTMAILMKPQGIFFLPILLFELIKRRKPRKFVSVFATGVITTAVTILPFAVSQEPLWIFKLYLSGAKEYTSATMNAFNVFALAGANFKDGSIVPFLFSYNTWGIIFDVLIFAAAGFLYLKSRHVAAPIVVAMVLNAGAFIFSVKMHERYMFPVLALCILAMAYLKDKRFMLLFAGFSTTVFYNMHILFQRVILYNNNVASAHLIGKGIYPVVMMFSILNILLFIYLVKVSCDVLLESPRRKIEEMAAGKTTQETEAVKEKKTAIQGKDIKPFEGIGKTDLIIMAIMTAVYLFIALLNLGSLKAPTTSWTPTRHDESVVVDLGREVITGSIYFYSGLGQNRPDTGRYSVQYRDAAGGYKPLAEIEKTYGNIFVWTVVAVPEVQARYLKIEVTVPNGTLNEVAFFEKGSSKPLQGVKIIESGIMPEDVGRPENLFDEVDKVDPAHTFRSGMIFDEIYHARTAYEYIHLMEPYEWTHPPLGKLFISLGILLFGMNPFGWRIIGTIFGVAMIPLMYMFGKKLFGGKFYAFCSAFLIMFDFMHFTLSRMATIDIYGTFFIILMYYNMYDYFINKSYLVGFRKSLKPLLLSGIFFGLGAASKWIGVYAGGGLALLFFLAKYLEYRDYRKLKKEAEAQESHKPQNGQIALPAWCNQFFSHYIIRTFLYCVLFFIIIPGVIYALSYIPYMAVPGPGHGFSVILRNQAAMLKYHSKDVLSATHTFSSFWWEWPLIVKPLLTYRGSGLPAGMSSSIAVMGNPAIWWSGILAIIAAIIIAVRKRDKKMAVVFTAIAFQYLPWVGITRITFIYHFFSTVPFMIFCIVYVIKYLMEKYPQPEYPQAKYGVYTYLATVLLLFIMFYPVLSGLEVSRKYVDNLLVWFNGIWLF